MTFYEGGSFGGQVQLTKPSGAALVEVADDEAWLSAGGSRATTRGEIERWTRAATERDDVLLFEVAESGRPVGQVFLHDIDDRQALVGYHLLRPEDRGRGIGTTAVALLVDYVRLQTLLEQLVIITAGDNQRSRRVAEKNGFALAGPPREDPTGLCFKMDISR